VGIRAIILGAGLRSFRAFGLKKAEFKDQILDPIFFTARPLRAVTAAGVLATSRLVRPTPTKSEIQTHS